jgi:hypothetical protein
MFLHWLYLDNALYALPYKTKGGVRQDRSFFLPENTYGGAAAVGIPQQPKAVNLGYSRRNLNFNAGAATAGLRPQVAGTVG